MIHYIDKLEIKDLEGKFVLARFDLNAAITNGKVSNDFKLEKVIPTFDFLRQKRAKILAFSHISKDKGYDSLLPVFDYLNGFFPVKFCKDYFTPEAVAMVADLKDGEVLLFENIRKNPGEDENDMEFAKKLSAYGDIYLNEAFSESHRKQASIVLLPSLLPHYGGLLFRQEVQNLSKVFRPERPFIFILGGAKFDTKLPIIKKYLEKADYVFVGGALANNFFGALGFELGTSIVSEGDFDLREMINNKKLILPNDVTVTKPDGSVSFKIPDTVATDECIVDVGPKTIEQIKNLVSDAKTILWNGPLGNYEIGFGDKTEQLAEIVAEATKNGAESIVGGGDTIASINKLGLADSFSFISTGGGAMLDYLVDETLVGIEALEK